jgi:hypothetical protein
MNEHPKSAPQERPLTPRQAKRLEGVPTSKAGLFRRIYTGKVTPRARIKAQCLDCTGFDLAAIRECTADACPLWGARPYQQKEGK